MTLAAVETRRDGLAAAGDMIRSILVHVQPEAVALPRLQMAAHLAGRLDATLVGVAAEEVNWAIVGDAYGFAGGEMIAALREQIPLNAAQARAAFDREAASLRSEWVACEGSPMAALCQMARAADLIIAGGSPMHEDTHRWCDPAELALTVGGPVLVAPPRGGDLSARAIVVAWKDSREARRALHDALPFLKAAEDVVVIEVCERQDDASATERVSAVVAGLRRHGVKAHGRPAHATNDGVAACLQDHAVRVGADLIVSGAYGHSRLGEWIFGGVTRDLLRAPTGFLLLSH